MYNSCGYGYVNVDLFTENVKLFFQKILILILPINGDWLYMRAWLDFKLLYIVVKIYRTF